MNLLPYNAKCVELMHHFQCQTSIMRLCNISTAFCSVVLLWERSLNLTKSNNCWYVLEFKNLFDIHSSDENETRIKQLVYHNTWGWGGIPFEQKKPNNIIYPVCDSIFRFFVSSFKSSEENKSIIYAANTSKNS